MMMEKVKEKRKRDQEMKVGVVATNCEQGNTGGSEEE